MENIPKNSISIARWANRGLWRVVALPWLIAALVLAAWGYTRLPETARSLTAFGTAAHAGHAVETVSNVSDLLGLLIARQRGGATNGASQDSAALIHPFATTPGVLAGGSWRGMRAASWIYRTEAARIVSWQVVEDPNGTPQSAMRVSVDEATRVAAPPVPSAAPASWRIHGELLDSALRRLRSGDKSDTSALVWRHVEQLPISGVPGYFALSLEELGGGDLLGAYVEIDPARAFNFTPFVPLTELSLLLDDYAFWVPIPVSLTAKYNDDTTLTAFSGDSLAGTFSAFYHLKLGPSTAVSAPIPAGAAWLAGDTVSLPGTERLFVGGVVPAVAVLAHALCPAAACFVIFLLSSLLLRIGAGWQFRRAQRELSEVVSAVRSLRGAAGPFYWSKSPLREIQSLHRAVEEAAGDSGTQEGVPAPIAVADDPAPAIILTENAAIDVRATPVVTEAPAAVALSADAPRTLIAPPVAFMQAMDSLRKQLADARRALEAQPTESARRHAEKEADLQLAERLLSALRGMNLETAPAELLRHALSITDSRVYRVDDGFKALRTEPGAPAVSTLPSEMARAEHPLLFLAVERARALWVDDAHRDPRTAGIFAHAAPSTPVALAALLLDDDHVWLALRPQSPLGWRAAEQVYAEALVRASVAQAEVPAPPPHPAAPEAPRNPEQSAHALWAQPNLPNDRDRPIFRDMVDSATAGLFSLNRLGRFLYANVAAERHFGVAGAQLLGRALSEFAAPGEDGAIASALQRVFEGAAIEERDVNFRLPAGGTVLLRLYLSAQQDESGEPTGIVGSVLNVTALRARELQLERSEALYRGIVEGGPQLLWSVDAIGCITFINQASREIYGYAPEELIGRPVTVLSDDEQARKDVEALALLLGGRPCEGYRTVHRHKDGTPLPLLVAAARHLDASGNVLTAVGVAQPWPSNVS